MGVRAYHYDVPNYDQDARAKLQAFMSPLVHGAFVPIPDKQSEQRCVEGRITSLRKEEPRPHSFRDNCMQEFADLVVQSVNLAPVCFDVVAEKQTSASQRLSIANACLAGPHRRDLLKCFLKSEAYQNVKDPRNISTYNDAAKLDMSMFTLALSEHCKQFPWYGPGMTPLQIANRVAEICENAPYVNISDYHRMDGTVTYVLRQVERMIFMKAFVNHRTELNELLKKNAGNTGRLPLGTCFQQGPSHGSGCPGTSVFQTLRAAFTSYLAYRHTPHPSGRTRTPRESFDALGCHLGDDGISSALPVASHVWASSKVGLVLEAHVVHRGERGVTFLARYYSPTVWYGCTDSMCDVKRQLSKFHTTVRLPDNVSPQTKLVEKAMSYVATDANTPVIGPLCTRVLLLSSFVPRRLHGIGNWWSRYEKSVQYPNSNVDGWMDVELDTQFPEFDVIRFENWLVSTGSVSEILDAPLCAEPVNPTPTCVSVVVDEAILPASEPHPEPQAEDDTPSECSNASTRSQPRRRKRRGQNDKHTRRTGQTLNPRPRQNGRQTVISLAAAPAET
jgi:hypothetical protein